MRLQNTTFCSDHVYLQALDEQGFGVPDEEAADWFFGEGTESALMAWQVAEHTYDVPAPVYKALCNDFRIQQK